MYLPSGSNAARACAAVLVVALATSSCSSGSPVASATPAAAPACSPVSDATDPRAAEMAAILASIKKRDNLSAVIFSAERNGKPILRTALGDSTKGVPATTAMHFRIGAVGWQYLTQVVLLMADRKQISLAAPVSTWYPAYPHVAGATVRMLASSRTGFGDYIRPEAFGNDVEAHPLRVWTANDLIARSLPPYQKPAFTPPGSNWAYSHTDFVMLGSIVEKLAKEPYATVLQNSILGPLGLRDTRLQFDANPALPALHTLEEGSFRDTTFFNPSFVSWAAMTSNVCDLATWTRAFGTGYGLSPASKAEVTAPANAGYAGNTADRYFGLGTIVSVPWNLQSAAYWGMYTSTAYDPATGISIEVTTSLNRGANPAKSPSNEVLGAISKLFTPGQPIRL